jgi:curved DNA-binding protein CbpA
MDSSSRSDPFSALGLPARPGITDDEVRAAWRRIAAASHPDRGDGGNSGQFAAAAAAYTLLRTPFGRNEALADLAGGADAGWRRDQPAYPLARARPGRPGLLAPRRPRSR